MEATVEDASWRQPNDTWSKDGKKCYAIFRHDTVKDAAASEKAGRPIFKPVVLIEKIIPGDPLNKPVRPMRESDKEEYPQEWARFEAKAEQQLPGTPLGAVTWLTLTQVAEYRALNIHTVEQLAELPDSVASRIMGFNVIRDKARTFLRASADAGLMAKMENEAREREAKEKALLDQIAALTEKVNQLMATPPKRPGRPKKVPVPVT